MRRGLMLRGYSPRTRTVYLGQVRRFLEWAGRPLQDLPDDPVPLVESYLLHLVGEGVSRSYHRQAVSALRFLFETVMERPRLAVAIPRPPRVARLPSVLGQDEVAELLARTRNLKHRALLMLLYSSGLRVAEVVQLRVEDLDSRRLFGALSLTSGPYPKLSPGLGDIPVRSATVVTSLHVTSSSTIRSSWHPAPTVGIAQLLAPSQLRD